ncbi:hypothetical protein FQA39_LY15683 [Lamprigera yunnana]|nr:hypothetical protein FQA39_LY15683 [Lamprigera yunnana]
MVIASFKAYPLSYPPPGDAATVGPEGNEVIPQSCYRAHLRTNRHKTNRLLKDGMHIVRSAFDDRLMSYRAIPLHENHMSDYNSAEEARLLQYDNASNEVLVDVTRYALDGDGDKNIEMWYTTYLNLEPVIQIPDGCGDYGSGGCQARLNNNSVLLTIEEWKTLMGLESYLTDQFFRDSTEIQH